MEDDQRVVNNDCLYDTSCKFLTGDLIEICPTSITSNRLSHIDSKIEGFDFKNFGIYKVQCSVTVTD